MERVRADQYPSTTDLDRVEAFMTTREEYSEYLDYLFEQVDVPRPSQQMMDRVQRLLAQIPAQA